MVRKHITDDNEEVEVLCVPWFPQQEESFYCFPYSVWMVLEYFKNVYNNKIIKKKIPNMNVEEIAKICRTDKSSGTRINDDLIRTLNDKVEPLHFELKIDTKFKDIKKHIGAKLPCIVLYDCGYLLYNIPSKVGHAGVVISIDKNQVFLNNPWLGAEVPIDLPDFNDAWEIEYKPAIFIKPNPQTKLNDENAK